MTAEASRKLLGLSDQPESDFKKWQREKREAAERENARKTREIEAQRQAAANCSAEAWDRWFASRFAHFIDEWVVQISTYWQRSPDGQAHPIFAGIADVMGMMRAELRKEFKAALEEQRITYEKKLANLEVRLQSARGKFPLVKTWRAESVTYQGQFATHDGALWQAHRDTAQTPGGSDWVCVASAGRDGQSVNMRGAFDTAVTYKSQDIVSFDGTAFIARKDAPGICPGPDWRTLAARGTKGPQGERGERGDAGPKGDAGPHIEGWLIEPEKYRASPRLSDGCVGPDLNLRPLFDRFFEEAALSDVSRDGG